jgi:hypothetical protein
LCAHFTKLHLDALVALCVHYSTDVVCMHRKLAMPAIDEHG